MYEPKISATGRTHQVVGEPHGLAGRASPVASRSGSSKANAGSPIASFAVARSDGGARPLLHRQRRVVGRLWALDRRGVASLRRSCPLGYAPVALLSVRDVTRRFGGIVALDRVSFDVEEGQIVGLIGPNGAGKTTAFNVITRLYRPDEGELEFAGESLLRTPPTGSSARASRARSRTSSSSAR